MNAKQAIRLLRELQRYAYINRRTRRLGKDGQFIRQLMIPLVSNAQGKQADMIAEMKGPVHETITEWISVRRLLSDQSRLATRRMVYQLPRYARMQRKSRPLVIALPHRWYVIRDGNHRCTAALMLGKTRIKCDVLRVKKFDVKRARK